MKKTAHRRRAVTVTEMLVVIGVIVTLAGILLAALASVKSSGAMTRSMNNLRQIGILMSTYSTDNRENIVPSQFDYSANPYPGKVRSAPSPASGDQHEGTWTDILWSVNEVNAYPEAKATLGQDYRYDSPDDALYDLLADIDENPFRSAALNERGVRTSLPTELALPFGEGANRVGEPGYFAANDFFNARPDRADGAAVPAGGLWYATGQMRFPDRSLYVVDSFAGEVIAPEEEPFEVDPASGSIGTPETDVEVDFRYNEDFCLMLFLDGHVSTINKWLDLEDLEKNRKIRVRDLDRNPSS